MAKKTCQSCQLVTSLFGKRNVRWLTLLGLLVSIIVIIMVTLFFIKLLHGTFVAVRSKCPTEISTNALQRIKQSWGLPEDKEVLETICDKGKLPEAFVKEYNPREVYCVTCTMMGWKEKQSTSTIVIVRQSGALLFIDHMLYRDRAMESIEAKPSMTQEVDDAVAPAWREFWNDTCPYPMGNY